VIFVQVEKANSSKKGTMPKKNGRKKRKPPAQFLTETVQERKRKEIENSRKTANRKRK